MHISTVACIAAHVFALKAMGLNQKLQPWEVSILNTRTPSARSNSEPFSSLSVKISDPNEIVAGTTDSGEVSFPSSSANCSLEWNGSVEQPFGWVTPCESSSSSAEWTVEMQGANATGYGPNPARDFKLQFKLEESVEFGTKVLKKGFVGVGAFALGDTLNMVCSASGFCNYGLRMGTVLIQQEQLFDSTENKEP